MIGSLAACSAPIARARSSAALASATRWSTAACCCCRSVRRPSSEACWCWRSSCSVRSVSCACPSCARAASNFLALSWSMRDAASPSCLRRAPSSTLPEKMSTAPAPSPPVAYSATARLRRWSRRVSRSCASAARCWSSSAMRCWCWTMSASTCAFCSVVASSFASASCAASCAASRSARAFTTAGSESMRSCCALATGTGVADQTAPAAVPTNSASASPAPIRRPRRPRVIRISLRSHRPPLSTRAPPPPGAAAPRPQPASAGGGASGGVPGGGSVAGGGAAGPPAASRRPADAAHGAPELAGAVVAGLARHRPQRAGERRRG